MDRDQEVVQPLSQGQTGKNPGIHLHQQVESAPRPLNLLLEVSGEGGGNQPLRQDARDVHGLPSLAVEQHGGMHVFRQPRRMPADAVQRRAAEGAVSSDGVHRPVGIHAHHHRAVEVEGLLGRALGHDGVELVIVCLHGLHEADLGILEVGHDVVQEFRLRHVVRVEDQANFSRSLLQRIVDIAGFGVHAYLAGDMNHAQPCAHFLQIGVVGLVTQVGGMGIADFLDGLQGFHDHFVGFAGVKGGQHVHRKLPGSDGRPGNLNVEVVVPQG